ncbi:LysR family substrate-binding domain-containing protein [Streptomyces sp. GC420]|uniref:LysR family substrate-binding domain-containing protein n=1 Tax=Streptomyces sp. GC420 TaxID=2697568 RepID=UPI001414E075|nr:LysR family substrate-binding domain-containing protein [Streptomyces sp. GC420]NBM16700.1 LysR family transcriptional regulator [Streptomyces sp. GC420]
MTGSAATPSFRLAYVPGVTSTKWVRIWNERLPDIPLTLVAVPAEEAPGLLLAGGADAGFVRLPVDRTHLSAIPLYTETTVVVVPKDHIASAVDELTTADLADDVVLHPLDDTLDWESPPGQPARERPATTADAVELVAAGVGVLAVPQSLARLHHRRDLTYRPLADAPQSRVALSWPESRTTDLVEHFIGIVRGRTVNSTRGRPATPVRPQQQGSPEARRRRPGTQGAGQQPVGKQTGGSGRGGSRGSGGPKGGKRPRRRS